MSVAGRGATGRGGGGAAGSPRWQKPRHAKLSACGGEPPRAMAMRRDGDIAPYRNGTVQRERAKGTRVVRTATGRCGAMGTSRPTAKPRGWCARQRDTATGIGGGHHGPWRGRGCGVPMGKKAISVSGVGAREIRQPNRNRLLRRGYWGHRPQGECRRKALRRRGRSAVRSFCRPSRCSVGALV